VSQPAKSSAGKVAGGAAVVLVIAGVLVAKWEGVRYQAYPDPATGGAPWTACYGHTGPEVKPGTSFTKAQCEAFLKQDLAQAQAILRRCVGRPMPQSVEAAYVSLVFNVGPRPVCQPNKTPHNALRAGDWALACKALDLYKRAAGRVMRGLVLRRADERKLCESGL
jgi:lysozyme